MNFDNNTQYLELVDEQASMQFAQHLASCLVAPLVLCFSGDIGAGKTTIVRAVLRCLGVESAIKSPTFSLVESYLCDDIPLHHFDLYRIHHEDELEYLGFRDYFSRDSICFIEWAEHAGNTLPQVDIRFKLSIKGAGRALQITALSEAGTGILACLTGKS
ncbi:tRNA (adenosine(37)-N6)-threonylcarbamoyltransferase complex ATPase subunit type 1 TsaE [uncultured Legionella sp.]|uniref:tRNA (adenosine(37)-N6)-threonylcarbamoyltransferase complex ATPase subunit type 1 TsaE n=1 Tax=uncultured Legionella sp. TaxID=210934 RepID=UPI00262DDE7E|nr:tRNA (adenosine(37)-N6)-threonylcarbamoyltransferase complex ATPase subunit type 1 TsaE [uncultured Legionella sp.]